ncbi:MAG: SMC-Scp complex subunit ScpB, partial [Afipia sp.]|nr:SMC-Scp complex subunit ScpB [Afipia sp.]
MATSLATKPVEDTDPSHETAESSPETAVRPEELRLLEAMLFASTEPL